MGTNVVLSSWHIIKSVTKVQNTKPLRVRCLAFLNGGEVCGYFNIRINYYVKMAYVGQGIGSWRPDFAEPMLTGAFPHQGVSQISPFPVLVLSEFEVHQISSLEPTQPFHSNLYFSLWEMQCLQEVIRNFGLRVTLTKRLELGRDHREIEECIVRTKTRLVP